ncbi:MAG: HD domain-containing protein [Clostridiales bacterium]|nr:HD domain-containing protein [Clostridiales bacterium]
MDTRFQQQMKFIYEIDKIKSIIRKTKLFDGSRHENDAEHSWHLAMIAMILSEYANEPVDVSKVIKMVLIHDIVEIDAGDTIVYDINPEEKEQEEMACANRIYGMLPDDQKEELISIWQEFEARTTPEAKFAAAIDRAEPIIQNYFNQGGTWKEHNIKENQVLDVNQKKIQEGSETFWKYIRSLLDECRDNEYYAE